MTELEERGAPVSAGRVRVEILAAMLLGVAGILTAYAAYQAGLADGRSLSAYTQSAKTTADANGFYTEAQQFQNQDIQLFTTYAIAATEDNEAGALYIRESLFDENLEAAVAWWEDQPDDGPVTPFVEENPELVSPSFDEAERLTAVAEDEFAQAQASNEAGDRFDLATVFFAVALFFGGIGSLFHRQAISFAVLTGGVLLLVPGLVAILQAHGLD